MRKAIAIVLLSTVLTGCSTQPNTPQETIADPMQETIEQTFDIYLYIANDNGENGELIGCGDSITPVQTTVNTQAQNILKEAITALLTAQPRNDDTLELSNIFTDKGLSLESISTQNNITTINII
jgi:PBP1b-binding outer membrane lipoprotein LpoB